METVTLRGEDFRTIHNTLCELRGLVERMTHSMIKINDVQDIITKFESGLRDAYEQDEASFDDKMEYYGSFANDNNLNSIWSMYEVPVHGFASPHPYPSDSFVVYYGKQYPVMGTTWGDIYRAADLAISASGDQHHVFIEGFEVEGNELHMYTGS